MVTDLQVGVARPEAAVDVAADVSLERREVAVVNEVESMAEVGLSPNVVVDPGEIFDVTEPVTVKLGISSVMMEPAKVVDGVVLNAGAEV